MKLRSYTCKLPQWLFLQPSNESLELPTVTQARLPAAGPAACFSKRQEKAFCPRNSVQAGATTFIFLFCDDSMDPPPDTTRPASPLLPDLAHPLRPRLLVLLLQGALLRRVLLHALGDGLVVLGDVVEQPLQALLDGLVHLLAVAQDGGAGFLLGGGGVVEK